MKRQDQLLSIFADWILPHRIRDDEEIALSRARQLALISYTVGLIVIPFAYVRFVHFPQGGLAPWALVLGAVVLFVAPLVVKATGSMSIALTIAGSGLAAVLIFYTQSTGGIFASSLLWYPLFPLLMAFFGGIKKGVFVIVILQFHLVYLYFHHIGLPIPISIIDDDRYVTMTVASSSIAFLLAFSFGVIADRLHRQALATAQDAEQSLRVSNISLEQRISERTQDLAESEERYRTLIDHSLQGMIVFRDNEILFANKAEAMILGFDNPQQLIGTPIEDRVAPEDRSRLREYRAAIRRGEAALRSYELRARRRDGSPIWIEVMEDAIPWQSGVAIQATHIDITDRKTAEAERSRLEAQLRQAQKMEAVGQLAGGVAHDFNNLLQIILGSAQLAKARRGGSERVDQDLGTIASAAQRGATLTQQLLAFSRRQAIEKTTICPNKVVEDLTMMLKRVIGEQIEMVVELDAELWPVSADEALLGQVLMNLCLNARDAMIEHGQLKLATGNAWLDEEFCRRNDWARSGQYVEIAVSDTGTGVSPEVREHMFEPFYTTKEVGKGSGLGLAVVSGIVEQHEGLISVESAPGRGTTVRVFLPCSPISLMASGSAESIGQTAAQHGSETILVAEDDGDVRDLAVRMLRGAGYNVLEAADGVEAVSEFERHADRIDLVLIDAVMPRLNGREAVLKIKKLRPALRIVFCSGYADDVIGEGFLSSIRASLLRKPYTCERLLGEIRTVLDTPQQTQHTI